MTGIVQLTTLVAACVCIAIFLTSFASAGLHYKNQDSESQGLLLICIALIALNMLITMNFPVLMFSMIVGISGWVLATILKNIFGVPAVFVVSQAQPTR